MCPNTFTHNTKRLPSKQVTFTSNIVCGANVGLMLAQQRWANIKPTLARCVVLTGDPTKLDADPMLL